MAHTHTHTKHTCSLHSNSVWRRLLHGHMWTRPCSTEGTEVGDHHRITDHWWRRTEQIFSTKLEKANWRLRCCISDVWQRKKNTNRLRSVCLWAAVRPQTPWSEWLHDLKRWRPHRSAQWPSPGRSGANRRTFAWWKSAPPSIWFPFQSGPETLFTGLLGKVQRFKYTMSHHERSGQMDRRQFNMCGTSGVFTSASCVPACLILPSHWTPCPSEKAWREDGPWSVHKYPWVQMGSQRGRVWSHRAHYSVQMLGPPQVALVHFELSHNLIISGYCVLWERRPAAVWGFEHVQHRPRTHRQWSWI